MSLGRFAAVRPGDVAVTVMVPAPVTWTIAKARLSIVQGFSNDPLPGATVANACG